MKDIDLPNGPGVAIGGDRPVHVSDDDVESVKALYRSGRYLDAWNRSRQIGPLHSWRGEEARITAGRLARVLGHQQLAHVCFYRAWKEHPQSSKALYYHARARVGRAGYYRVRQMLERHRHLTEQPGKGHAQWLAFRAMLYSRYRDFQRADTLIAEALREDPNDAWLHCEYSFVLELEDRYPEALAAIRRAYVVRDNYRPALQQEAYLLQLMGRDDEALELLQRARGKVQCFSLYWQLLDMLMERKAWNQAAQLLDEIEELSPIRDKYAENWIHARRGEIHYYQGRYPQAIASIAKADTPYYRAVCHNLENAIYPPRMRLLEVDFVRQHHDTCGPATMSAILGFLGCQVSQQEIVDSIWYAGTTAFDERRWALEQGLYAREFKLDRESARQLIDAGIPVAVTTEEPDSAHLQALVGYDDARGVFFIRDPYEREYQEFLIDRFLERYAASGPRALLLLPDDKVSALEGIDLPEAEQYDALYQMKVCLDSHDLEAGRAELREIARRWPGSRMAILSAWSLACYESNIVDAQDAMEHLQALYPEDEAVLLRRQRLMAAMGRNRERRELLSQAWAGGGMHQALLQEYIDLCAEDARDNDLTRQLLGDMLRRCPQSAAACFCLAGIQWTEREFDQAIESYRMAACLDSVNEGFALAYFKAGRLRGQEQEALDWLMHRCERFGERSAQPAITYYRACEFMDQEARGIEFLYQTLEKHDSDGDLQLFLVDQLGNLGRLDEADRLLQKSRGQVRDSDWLMSQAELFELQGSSNKALTVWQSVSDRLPQNLYVRERYCRLLASLRGRGAVQDYLRALTETCPDQAEFCKLRLQWSDGEAPVTLEAQYRHLLQIDPGNAWGMRNLAVNLLEQGRAQDAMAQLELTEKVEPNRPGNRILKGDIWHRLGDTEQAAGCYRQAIELSVDATSAYERLLGCARDAAQRRRDLDFIHQQLIRQTINNDAMMVFRDVAGHILSAQELLEHLQQGWRARPDSWYAWAALINQYQDMQQFDQAETLAAEATERFPFLPRLWLERARGYRLQGEFDQERRHLRKALDINPNYAVAVRLLSDNYSNCGEYTAARDLLQAFLQNHQDDSRGHAYLADVLWAMKDTQGALHHMEQAVRLDPDYPWAWDQLSKWDDSDGDGRRSVQLARELVQRRPGDLRAWLCLSRISDNSEEALQAVQQAVELAPASQEAHQQRVRLLVEQERYADALAAWQQARALHGLAEFAVYRPWILRRQDKVEEAIAEIRGLLEHSPFYGEGWRLLAIWARDSEQLDLALEAFAKYLELNPGDLDVVSDYAGLLQEAGQVEAALDLLRRSARLAPGNTGIVLSLFDLLLESGLTGEARELTALMETHLRHGPDGPWVEARLVHLLAKEDKQQQAFDQFRRVCTLPENNRWLIDSGFEALEQAGWEQQCRKLQEEMLDRPEQLGPAVGGVLGERLRQQQEWQLDERRLAHLSESGAVGRAVFEAWLDHLIEATRFRDLDRIIDHYREWLRADDSLWGTIGYGYARQAQYDVCVRWMADWQSRPEAPAWALNALAMSLREKLRFGSSFSVVKKAIQLPADNASDSLRLYAAVEYGLHGDRQQFIRWLELVDPECLNRYDRFVWQLAGAMRLLYGTMSSQQATRVHELREMVAAAKRELPEYHWDGVASLYLLRISYHLGGVLGGWPFRLYWWLRLQLA